MTDGSALTRLVRDVHTAQQGPDVVAIFDYDGTVIDGYSALEVYRDRILHRDIGFRELVRTGARAAQMGLLGSDVHGLMNGAVAGLAGRRHDDLREWGSRLFRERFAAMIFPGIRRLVEAHRRAGHHLVMATSATEYQARDVAEDLGFDALVCTFPEVRDDALTGRLAAPPLWGPAKARAIGEYLRRRGADAGASYAYSNGAEDVPLLEEVGNPVALNPDDGLRGVARSRGWATADLAPPKRGVSPIPVARTAAALGALVGAAGVGLGAAVAADDRRTVANLVATVAPDLALTLAGVRVRVRGAEKADAARPAVFVFNHQSSLDLLVLGAVLRTDVTGIAKKEAARDPRFAAVGALFDVAYVDRSGGRAARDGLRPAVDKLRSGISIAIAPEGTRSPTPQLGPFKKGAFHLARQAGVPIVPIVIHGAGDLMWRNSLVAHAGTVDVEVLDPVPADTWTTANLDDAVAEVRESFVAALRERDARADLGSTR